MYYINIFKKIFVNSVNMPLKQKVSVDYGTTPTMVFSLLDKCGKPFNIPTGAMFYIAGDTDYNQDTAPCFYSTDYSIDGNTITFNIETYTEEFLEKVKNPDTSLVIEIGMKLDDKSFVMLQDSIIAQPRVFIEGKPLPSVGEEFYTKGEVDEILTNYATKTYVDEIETQIRTEIENVADTIPDLADYTGDVSLKRQYNNTTLNTFQANESATIAIGDGTKNVNQTISINTGAGAGVVVNQRDFTVTMKDGSSDQYPLSLSFGEANGGHFYTGMNDYVTNANTEAVDYFLSNNGGYRECHVAHEINNVVSDHYRILFSDNSYATFSVDGSKRLSFGMQNSSTTNAYAIDAKVSGTAYTIAIGRNADSPTSSFSGCTVNTYVRGTAVTVNSQNNCTVSCGKTMLLQGLTTRVMGNDVEIRPRSTANGLNFSIQTCNSFTFNGAGLNTAGGLVKIGDDGKIPSDLIDVAGGSADLSNYVGGISITGEIENYENKPVLNYEVKSDVPTIKIGNTENVIPADGAGMNLEQKADDVKIIAGKNLTLQAYKSGNSKYATMFLSDTGRFDLESDVFSYYGDSFQINGAKLNYNNGLCLLDDKGNIPFYISEPYINKLDSLRDVLNFNFSNDRKIDWYTYDYTGLTFDIGTDAYYQYPDGQTKNNIEDFSLTKEIWISPVATVEVISIPEKVQVIGDMPTSLAPTKEIMYEGTSYEKQLTHVFVVRGICYMSKWIYTINYAYNFISDYTWIF